MKKIVNTFYWILIGILGLLSLYFTTGVINGFFIGAVVIGAFFSIYKSIKCEGYVLQTLAVPDNGRTPVYDYLRCLAVIFVIGVHVLGTDLTAATELSGTLLYQNLSYLRWWFFNCNMIFVMISGALLLQYKEESIVEFYGKRATKIIIPLVIYYIWYLWQANQLAGLSFAELFMKILTADIYTVGASHFWLIYDLLAVYIVVPFLRPMLKNISYQLLSGLIAVFFIMSIFDKYVTSQVDIVRPFAGWLAVAVSGYWCAKEETRKYDNYFIGLGALSCVLMAFVMKYDANFPITLDNLSPYRFAVAVGIFSLFFKLRNHLKNIYAIRVVSKYSYGIILIHLWILGSVERVLFKMSSVMYKGAGMVFTVVMTLILSLVAAYFVENLFTVIFTTICDKLFVKRK